MLIGGKTNYYNPCSYIRLLSPLNELTKNFSIYIIDNNDHAKFFHDLNENKNMLDIIIVQRDIFDNSVMFNLNLIKLLFEKFKNKNTEIIFDIDDDLINIDKTHGSYEKYTKLKNTLEYLLRNSDIITVTNQNLKKQLIAYNKNIIILPNTLMNIWNFNSKKKIEKLNSTKTIKIGYFGSTTHNRDIEIVENAIKNIKNYFPNKRIVFEIIGVCNENHEWIKRINIPRKYPADNKIKNIIYNHILNRFQIFQTPLPYPIFIEWMKNEIEWDIAVAPLEDTNINRSKSNLKYLEYTALNIPGVYSNIGPYKEIGEKNSGIVVNNTPEEWENAIIKLIEDEELYETILINAHNDVEKNYLVENASLIWNEMINNLSD